MVLSNIVGKVLNKLASKADNSGLAKTANNYLKVSSDTDWRLTTAIYSGDSVGKGIYNRLVDTLKSQGITDTSAIDRAGCVTKSNMIILPLPTSGLSQSFKSNFSEGGDGFMGKVSSARTKVVQGVQDAVATVKNVSGGQLSGYVSNDEWSLIQMWKKDNSSFCPTFNFKWDLQAINDELGEIYYTILALIILTVPTYYKGVFTAPGPHFGLGEFTGVKVGSLSLKPTGGTRIDIRISDSFYAQWVGITNLTIDYDLNSLTRRGKVSKATISMDVKCTLPVYNYNIPTMMGLNKSNVSSLQV